MLTVSAAPPPNGPKAVLLYDADCGFCRRMLRIVLGWDAAHELEPVALQEQRAAELLAPMPRDLQMRSWHLVRPDGRVFSGGAAAPELLDLLGRWRFAASAARRMPGLNDRAYRFVADRRAFFGRVTRRLPDLGSRD